MTIKVYVADDHPLFRQSLEWAFGQDGRLALAGLGCNGLQAEEDILRLNPDVAVVDLSMPGQSGLDVLKAVSEATKVIMLTGSDESGDVYTAMASGAKGFLLKSMEWREICDAIVAVYNGENRVSQELLSVLQDQIQRQNDVQPANLTARELEILTMIAGGMTQEQIAAQLHLVPATVKTHLRNLYRKMGVKNGPHAVAEGFRRSMLN